MYVNQRERGGERDREGGRRGGKLPKIYHKGKDLLAMYSQQECWRKRRGKVEEEKNETDNIKN